MEQEKSAAKKRLIIFVILQPIFIGAARASHKIQL